jgi:hypothetical protein
MRSLYVASVLLCGVDVTKGYQESSAHCYLLYGANKYTATAESNILYSYHSLATSSTSLLINVACGLFSISILSGGYNSKLSMYNNIL